MGRRLIDRVGRRFGRLVVVRQSRIDGQTWASCVCDCGKLRDVRTGALRPGCIQSCGCLRSEYRRAQWFKHGEGDNDKQTPEYRSWQGMIRRCEGNEPDKARRYRDRGITVCERWRHDYIAFLLDMGRKPSPKHSIDREDNDGNYTPDNCRWATAAEQARNRAPRQKGGLR